jgi:hypothetical protein
VRIGTEPSTVLLVLERQRVGDEVSGVVLSFACQLAN